MIPIHLELKGFLSYQEPARLDFTTFELACISGINGAGKSSLLDAMTWALFGQARKRDEALVNAQSNSAEVVYTFAYEGNIYRVRRALPRGKTSQLEFQIWQGAQGNGSVDLHSFLEGQGRWKPLSGATLRATQELIQQTLRMDYDTFVNASFFLQGRADQFTQQRPGDRKRILSSILGLEIWDVYHTRALEMRRGVEQEIDRTDTLLREIHQELEQEPKRKSDLARLENELIRITEARKTQQTSLDQIKKIADTVAEQRKLVHALGGQSENTARQLNELIERRNQRQAEREKYAGILARAEEIQNAYRAWEQARTDLEYWNEIAIRFHEQEKRRQPHLQEIASARARLEQERDTLTRQSGEVERQVIAREDLLNKIEAMKGEAATIETELSGRAGIEAELNIARAKQAEAKAENPRLKTEMDTLKERIEQLQDVEGASCPVCGKPLGSDERLQMITDLTSQGQAMGDRYRGNLSLLRDSDQNVQALEEHLRQHAQLETRLGKHRENLAQLSTQLEQLDRQKTTWEEQGASRLEEVLTLLEKEGYALEARAQLMSIDAELKNLGYDPARHAAAREQELNGRSTANELNALQKAQATLAPLDREIQGLDDQAARLESEHSKQEKTYSDAAAALAAAEAQLPDIDEARRRLYEIQEQEQQIRMEFGAAQQRVTNLEDQKKRQKTLSQQRDELAGTVSQYRKLEAAFGKNGVPALLIEQALPQIETKANEILERLSGGSMSVRFETRSPYKDKSREDLKETLDIQISDGAGTRDYEMFSGGEAFRVDFAIRLALSEVLAQRAGARLQTLVIDEGFGSQDSEGRQRLIEAINMVRQDFARILVITHIDELKEAFPNRIEVEKTADGSSIRVV
jgi:exonuclease SbcC